MTDQNKSDRLENVGNLTLTSLEFHVGLEKRLVDGAGGGLGEKSSFQESRVSSEQVSGCQLCRAHVLAYFADLTIKSARTRLQSVAVRRRPTLCGPGTRIRRAVLVVWRILAENVTWRQTHSRSRQDGSKSNNKFDSRWSEGSDANLTKFTR